MCEPISATTALTLGAASSVASAGAGFIAQGQQAKAESKYQNALYNQTAEQALASLRDQVTLGNRQLQQDAAAASQQSLGNARDGNQGRGIATVRAAAGGVGGVTADELVDNFTRLESENENIIRTNLAWQREQMGEQYKGMTAQAQSRITGATPRPISGPSPFALVSDLSSSFLDYHINKKALE